MSESIIFDGVRYISARDAASLSGYAQDHISRMARQGKFEARQLRRNWYIGEESFRAFLLSQSAARDAWKKQLSAQRRGEATFSRRPIASGSHMREVSVTTQENAICVPRTARPIFSPLLGVCAAFAIFAGSYAMTDLLVKPNLSQLTKTASIAQKEIAADFRAMITAARASETTQTELVARQESQVAAVSDVFNGSETTEVPQSPGIPVTSEIEVQANEASYGDVVSYDAGADAYVLSTEANADSAYGVMVEQPAIIFRTGTNEQETTAPVVQEGRALMNVTLENGPIEPGDLLTPSSVPGKARKADSGDHIIGEAEESFTGGSGVLLSSSDGTEIVSGTIVVNARMRIHAPPSVSAGCSGLFCNIAKGMDAHAALALIRYVLAGAIAIASLLLAFRSFMSDVNYGVISIGRNPRAKSSIQSMVFFNALLAILIAGVGLFASLAVLFISV